MCWSEAVVQINFEWRTCSKSYILAISEGAWTLTLCVTAECCNQSATVPQGCFTHVGQWPERSYLPLYFLGGTKSWQALIFAASTMSFTYFMMQLSFMFVFALTKDLAHIHDILKNVFLVFPNYCLGRGLMDVAFNEYQNEYYFKTGKDLYRLHIEIWAFIQNCEISLALCQAKEVLNCLVVGILDCHFRG